MGHFKHSTIAYHKLDQIQDRLDINKHKLQQDKPTRWNSTLYMLLLLRRFDDIEESQLLLMATCLDPRFKDKVFSCEGKGLARKCMIDNIVDTDVEVEPQSKRPRTEFSNDSSVEGASTSKIWECLTEILHDCGATTDGDSGKEIMADQYFSEPLIDCKKGNPYTWWYNNRLWYPLLAKLATRYLGICVPHQQASHQKGCSPELVFCMMRRGQQQNMLRCYCLLKTTSIWYD